MIQCFYTLVRECIETSNHLRSKGHNLRIQSPPNFHQWSVLCINLMLLRIQVHRGRFRIVLHAFHENFRFLQWPALIQETTLFLQSKKSALWIHTLFFSGWLSTTPPITVGSSQIFYQLLKGVIIILTSPIAWTYISRRVPMQIIKISPTGRQVTYCINIFMFVHQKVDQPSTTHDTP